MSTHNDNPVRHSLLVFLLTLRPVRLFLWFLTERARYAGSLLLTLRQYRRLGFAVNQRMLGGTNLPKPETGSALCSYGWCDLSDSLSDEEKALLCTDVLKVFHANSQNATGQINPCVVANQQVLSKLPSVRRLINNPDVSWQAGQYLGEPAKLRDIDLLYSRVQSGISGAQHYHLDNIAQRALRLIFHIEEVTPNQGPFTFFNLNDTNRIVARLNYLDRRDYNALTDTELQDAIRPEKPVSLTGAAGSLFLADTCRCLHHGSRVDRGYRLVLMATLVPSIPTNLRWLRTGISPRFKSLPI